MTPAPTGTRARPRRETRASDRARQRSSRLPDRPARTLGCLPRRGAHVPDATVRLTRLTSSSARGAHDRPMNVVRRPARRAIARTAARIALTTVARLSRATRSTNYASPEGLDGPVLTPERLGQGLQSNLAQGVNGDAIYALPAEVCFDRCRRRQKRRGQRKPAEPCRGRAGRSSPRRPAAGRSSRARRVNRCSGQESADR